MKPVNPNTLITLEPCFCQVKDLSLLICEGEDARTFLQGQVTADVGALTTGQATLSACLNLKGRAISSFFLVAQTEQCYWLILPSDILDKTQESLDKYAVFSKVTIKPFTPTQCIFGIAGQSQIQLKEMLSPKATIPSNRYEYTVWDQHLLLKLNGSHRYLLVAPQDQQNQIDPLPTTDSSTHSSNQTDYWMMHQILSTETLVSAKLSEKIIPSNLGYDALGAISYDKGCYRGQEVIARLHYRGESKEGLYLLHATFENTDSTESQAPNDFAGKTLRSSDQRQQAIGTLISGVQLKENTMLLLVICKRALLDAMLEDQTSMRADSLEFSQLQSLEIHYTD